MTPVPARCVPEDSAGDDHWMRLALELAGRGEGRVEPNPMVGCVLVRDGQLIAQGYHRQFGGPHAEIEALSDCDDPRGATAYVTLEPCCHHGKTPPCCDALLAAGISRVVVAMEDPFPMVAGGGLSVLRAAGIETAVGALFSEASELNSPYLKRIQTGRPWVIAKWAMTLDGRIATVTGESQWITGEASRREVHRLRGHVDVIAVGMGTVVADNPRLTARVIDEQGQSEPIARIAARMVFCRHRTPALDSQLVRSLDDAPMIVVAGPSVPQQPLRELNRVGVGVWRSRSANPTEMVAEAVQRSGRGEGASDAGEGKSDAGEATTPATNWMLEGGSQLLASFFAAGQVDECQVYVGPLVFGGKDAAGPVAGAGTAQLVDADRFGLRRIDRFGDDVRLLYRRRNIDNSSFFT